MFATSTLARNLAATAVAAVFATACLTAAVAPAAAATAPTVSKTVSYADLNLNNPQGRAALEQRIKSAARAVCKTDAADVASRTVESRCIKSAIAAATVS